MGIRHTEIGNKIPFEKIIDAMGDSVCIVADDFTIVYQNATLLNLLGDHTGESCYSVFHNIDDVCNNCPVAEAIKTGQPKSAVKKSYINGREMHVGITASPIFGDDGSVLGVVESVKDITEMVRLREAVASSEELFKQIAVNVPGVVWMRDSESKELLYLSPNFEKVWGRPREEVYGRWERWLDYIHEDDREMFLDTLKKEVLEKGEFEDVTYEMEYRIVRPSGEVRWIRNRGFSVRDNDGRVYRYAGFADDITELKAVDERREDMFAMLRHDLRNPLTVIEANIDLVTDWLDKEVDAESLTVLNAVKNKVRSLNTMIDDLSMIARAHSPAGAMKFVPQQLSMLVTEAVVLSKDEVKSKGLTLERDISDNLASIAIDKVSVQRAITNLLQNAIKYTPAGGTITVSLGESCDYKDVCDKCQVVTVSDNGPGIPADARKRVFDKYFRLDKCGTQGTGLGLAIVKAVAEAHGGKVELITEEGRGSKFSIIFPCRRVEA